MSRRVSQKDDVSVVTGGQRRSDGGGSHVTQHQALEEDATNLLLTTILTDWGLGGVGWGGGVNSSYQQRQSGGANYAIETE